MISSMTAFGRALGTVHIQPDSPLHVTLEMRSVNNRYLDTSVRLPRLFGCLEDRFKPYLQSHGITRGKVDLFLTYEGGGSAHNMELNPDAVRAYLASLYQLRDEYGLPDDITVTRVAANPAVFADDTPAIDPDALWAEVEPILCEAVSAFCEARRREGERLRADLLGKLAHLTAIIEEIGRRSAEDITTYHSRLEERLRTVLADNRITVDENRILTECAIYADKVAVDEELVRLGSHFALFRELMDADEPVGRKLDFLLQEMNREVNTTGSKCSDAAIAHLVVDAKNELEKIREQIQNLE